VLWRTVVGFFGLLSSEQADRKVVASTRGMECRACQRERHTSFCSELSRCDSGQWELDDSGNLGRVNRILELVNELRET